MYALGRNPKRLQELAKIEDPVKFAIEVGKVSALMKVTTRKPTVAPESGVRGGSPGVTSTGAKTDAMLKKPQAAGDYTWVWECGVTDSDGREVVRRSRQSTLGGLALTPARFAARPELH